MSGTLNDCGCCEGNSAIIPAPLTNRPGLSRVRYRVGTHAEFLDSALAALSDPRRAPLHSLSTRSPDDFTIALLDAWAALADVLTFYQERIAGELWLRPATERDSVLRLARLIGYRLRPGVAAETALAFLLDETPGAPAHLTIAPGAKVQSIPGPGEKAQTFETIESLDARVEWNALRPAVTTPSVIAAGVTSLYLSGTATNLQPGDAIVIVGDERAQSGSIYPDKERWDLRVLESVTPDTGANRTRVTWAEGLGKAPILPAAKNVKVYALRQRAALFGHNAPDPAHVMVPANGAVGSWPTASIENGRIDLDNAYSKIVAGSWVALVNATGYAEVYRAVSVSFPSRAGFALSAKVTRIEPDVTEHLSYFDRQGTVVFAQSELLEMTAGPLIEPAAGSLAAALTRDPGLLAPVEGSTIALRRLVPDLAAGRGVIVTGRPLRVRVATASLTLLSADGLQTAVVARGESLVLTARPTLLAGNLAKWTLSTNGGFEGVVTTSRSNLVLTAANDDDPTASEAARVQAAAGYPTALTLASPPLARLYDRATVTIAANVAAATHGESVAEILGSGNAALAHQRFTLKQTPLTHVRSTASGGAASTLEIRVGGLLWSEVPTLHGRGPREHVFTTTLADDGAVTVQFGDGKNGARLPSGTQNVKAAYRRGIGLAGLVRAGQLTTLLTRPPGLSAAINPLAATGADGPEALASARVNAPVTVLTLDRVVSLEDYENFSRAYAGIAKALATWTWDGRTRGVFVTVSGPGGTAVPASLAQDLIAAIHGAGDPWVPVRTASFVAARFRVSAQILVHPDHEAAGVLTAVEAALRAEFAFEGRAFGQPAMLSEVIVLVQATPGVVAVNVRKFYRTGAPAALNARIDAALPVSANPADPGTLAAAELLMLDPAPLDLEVLP